MKGYWKLVAAALAVTFLTLTTSCNTIRGVGQDIERGGEKLQEATED